MIYRECRYEGDIHDYVILCKEDQMVRKDVLVCCACGKVLDPWEEKEKKEIYEKSN